MNVTAPAAVSVRYKSGVIPPESATRTRIGARLSSVSGVTPCGTTSDALIVIEAATAAGGTSNVPLYPPTTGSGAVVALLSGMNVSVANACVQLGAAPVKPEGHAVCASTGTA